MPQWLIEDLGFLALLLSVGAVALLIGWARTGNRKYAVAAGVTAGIAIAAALVWFFLNQDQREIRRKVEEIAENVGTRNLDRVFRHVSAEFRYGSHDKRALREAAQEALRRRDVTGVRVWDVQVEELSREQRTARVSFHFKGRGNWGTGAEFYLCRAVFVLDPDHEWRLKSFQVFNPAVNTNEPIAIPGL